MPAVFDLDDIIVQLRTSWGGDAENATFPLYSNTFYYALLTSAPNDSSPENAGWQALTSLMEARAAEAFELWDDLIPRNLIQYLGSPPADAPVIQFAYSSTTDKGGTYEYPVTGYYLGTNEFGGQSWEINRAEIWLNSGWSTHSTSSAINQTGYGYYGGYGFLTYMHEIGHALGLSHPGSYNAGDDEAVTYGVHAEYAQDTRRFTIMSYFYADEDGSDTDYYGSNGFWQFAQTPMLHDIAAIQEIYGTDLSTRAEDTTYGFNSTAGKDVYDFSKNDNPILTIYDAGGIDTLDFSGFGSGQYGGQVINLTPGTWSDVGGYMTNNVAIAFGTWIENAIGGTGNDTIIGNGISNRLYGNNGNDRLDGGFGVDFLFGGAGFDTGVVAGASSEWTLVRFGNVVQVYSNSTLEHDWFEDVELLDFTNTDITVANLASNEPYSYMATYSDILSAFGPNPDAAIQHYFYNGYYEGRTLDGFDEWSYLAGYKDLLNAFGTDGEAATLHYVYNGFWEGRARDAFDEWSYLASNTDLIGAIGPNGMQATQHYVTTGYGQGREVNTFDAFRYIASYGDLIQALGPNGLAGEMHYVYNGYYEGRVADFDAQQYLDNYQDLQNAYGSDLAAATLHYIYNGFYEGRTDEA